MSRLMFAVVPPLLSAALVVALSVMAGAPHVGPGAVVAFALNLPWSTYFAFRRRSAPRGAEGAPITEGDPK